MSDPRDDLPEYYRKLQKTIDDIYSKPDPPRERVIVATVLFVWGIAMVALMTFPLWKTQ